MKSFAITALLLGAMPAFAQDIKTGSSASVSAFSADMPIEAIAADPRAKSVLDTVFPGMTAHAMYDQFKSMSVKQLQPMASDRITDAAIAKLASELAAIK